MIHQAERINYLSTLKVQMDEISGIYNTVLGHLFCLAILNIYLKFHIHFFPYALQFSWSYSFLFASILTFSAFQTWHPGVICKPLIPGCYSVWNTNQIVGFRLQIISKISEDLPLQSYTHYFKSQHFKAWFTGNFQHYSSLKQLGINKMPRHSSSAQTHMAMHVNKEIWSLQCEVKLPIVHSCLGVGGQSPERLRMLSQQTRKGLLIALNVNLQEIEGEHPTEDLSRNTFSLPLA